MNEFFFELIRVAIGNQVCLSHTPTAEEWGELYAMAKKQSLVGVCFAGVQRLQMQRLQMQRQAPPEMLYLQWMGMAAKIQQRNDVVNSQCVEVQSRLRESGMQSVILKGQGVASYYPIHLMSLRQPGDIDAYVFASLSSIIAWCKSIGKIEHFDYVHCMVNGVVNNSVELHYRFGYSSDFIKNRILQKWFKRQVKLTDIVIGNNKLRVPSVEFNAVYLIHHIYKHLFTDCIGLKQILDYYWLVKNIDNYELRTVIKNHLESLGLIKLTSAVMWVLKIRFGLDDEHLICKPSEVDGRLLLRYILTGKFYANNTNSVKLKMIYERYYLFLNYPTDVICRPVWILYHAIWKRATLIKLSLQLVGDMKTLAVTSGKAIGIIG